MTVPSGDKKQWIDDAWELKFIESLTIPQLSKLLMACNYLNLPSLFELCCASMASAFKA